MTNKPSYWILRHKDDGRVLCTDGKRRHKAACARDIKMYRTEGWALRRAKYDYSCHAVYGDDSIDCCGVIRNGEGVPR